MGAKVRHISTDDVRQMTDSDGLVLRGCGGDPQEWVDGINTVLTDEKNPAERQHVRQRSGVPTRR
jgi:hypothetical protein